MVRPLLSQQQNNKKRLIPVLVFLIVLLLSACNSDVQLQQHANQNKIELDKIITHAQSIGVPSSLLQPIIQQEKTLDQTHAPLTLFSAQANNDYHTNLSQNYKMLTVQVRGLEKQSTEQLTYQAAIDLQTFSDILGQRQAQKFVEAQTFADQLAQNQTLMAEAQEPKTFLQISTNAKDAIQALHLLGTTYDKLQSLQNAAKQMQDSNLDMTALNQQLDSDVQSLRTAKKAADFTQIDHQLDAQLQSTVTLSTQAIPYVGEAKLNQFSTAIDTMKQAGLDINTYQQHLDADRNALKNAKSLNDFLQFASQVNTDVASTRIPLLQANAKNLLQQFHQEVATWGDKHQFVDPYNSQNYRLGYEYDQAGIGSDADSALNAATTPDDYQAVIDLVNSDMFNLKAMEADSTDTTPADQIHTTDKQALEHYQVTSGQVVVVSLTEEALRLYQDGQLVKSFLITSGQYDKPSLPGFWHIMDRESPTKFKSSAPKGSALWYPDTKINFAMGYHSDGYFFHDSWWRLDYGPHTNFPHADSGGDTQFAGNGSHGCINMPEDLAGWLYNNTSYSTSVIIY